MSVSNDPGTATIDRIILYFDRNSFDRLLTVSFCCIVVSSNRDNTYKRILYTITFSWNVINFEPIYHTTSVNFFRQAT